MSIASPEIRKRAIEAYTSGKGTQFEVANMFGIHRNTLANWLKDYNSEGRLEPRQRGHMAQAFSESEKERIKNLVSNKADITLEEIREKLGKNCSLMAVHRELIRQEFKFKKNSSRLRARTGRRQNKKKAME